MKVLIGVGANRIAMEMVALLAIAGEQVEVVDERNIPPGTHRAKLKSIAEPKAEPYYTYKEGKSKGEKKRQRSEWNRRMK